MTPALADANNGNWRTAERWAAMLASRYRVSIAPALDAADATCAPDVLLALHARRSHASIHDFSARWPDRPCVVALTGTDLYGDVPALDAEALESLTLATALIVLQGDAVNHVPTEHRRKVSVVYQSAESAPNSAPAVPPLECLVVGHLRREKDPATLCRAVGELSSERAVRIRHIGRSLDESLAQLCRETAGRDSRYQWLGEADHHTTREMLAQSHVLIHPSVMEGGAQAVIEAVVSGVAVIASRMSGNVGLLGEDYDGYFDVGDALGLARLLHRAAGDPQYLSRLRGQCQQRAPLFTERAEANALIAAVTQAASTRIRPT